MQEVKVGLAVAKDISMNATVVEVLSKLWALSHQKKT